MNQPLIIDLPHTLGTQEAKRRLQNGIGKLADHIPGNVTQTHVDWQGDRMNLAVEAMGQKVSAHIDVEETCVRVEMLLPPALSFLGGLIGTTVKNQGSRMLEDKTAP